MADTRIRAFIAIHLSSEMLASIARIQRDLKSALPGAALRWTKPKQIHLTLKFLGNVAIDSLDDLKKAIGRASERNSPFAFSAVGLGVFPNPQRPRVFWVGVGGDMERLRKLQKNVEDETRAWREPEERDFHPHLTLARVEKIKPESAQILRETIHKYAATQFGVTRVERIYLMQSKLSSAGAEHFSLAEFPLSGQCCLP